MSLILDALKQADRERRRGQASDVTTLLQMTSEPSLRRGLRIWLCLAVLGIGVGVIWLVSYTPRAPIIGKIPAPPASTATKDLSPPIVRKEGGRPQKEYLTSRSLQKSPPMKIGSPLPKLTPSRPMTPMTPPAEETGSFNPKDTFIQNPESISAGPLEPASDPRVEKEDMDIPRAELASDIQKDDPPLISDLPLEIQESLKGIEINAHVFNDDLPKRFVFINQRSYRVGDRIGDNGPLLKEITPDGIVVDYGKGLARLLMKSPGR